MGAREGQSQGKEGERVRERHSQTERKRDTRTWFLLLLYYCRVTLLERSFFQVFFQVLGTEGTIAVRDVTMQCWIVL